MLPMPVTLAVFQAPIGWLKVELPPNISAMSVTFAVFQEPMFWLNAIGPLSPQSKSQNSAANIRFMLVTLEVSHPLMSWLKWFAPSNVS